MPHSIVPIRKDGKTTWYLDDENHPIIRMEPHLVFYKENDEIKVTSFANTVGALVNMGHETPAKFTTSDGYGCLYSCGDDPESLFSDKYIVDPSKRTLYFPDPKPCSVELNDAEWKQFLSQEFKNFKSGTIIYYDLESEVEENPGLASIVPQNDIWKIISETGKLPQLEEYAKLDDGYVVSFKDPESQDILYSKMTEKDMQKYMNVISTTLAENYGPEVGGSKVCQNVDESSTDDYKLVLENNQLHLYGSDCEVGLVVVCPNTIKNGENIEVLIEDNSYEESIFSTYSLTVTEKLLQDLPETHLSEDKLSATGLKALYKEYEFEQNIHGLEESMNEIRTLRYDKESDNLTLYCGITDSEILELKHPIIVQEEPLQISSRAENGALTISEFNISQEGLSKLKDSLESENKFLKINENTVDFADISMDSIVRIVNIADDNFENPIYLQKNNGELIPQENIKFVNMDLGVVIEDKDGTFVMHLVKDPQVSNPDMPNNISFQNMDDISFLSLKLNMAITHDGIVLPLDDEQKNLMVSSLQGGDGVINYGDIFVRESENSIKELFKNAPVIPLDDSPVLSDLKIYNSESGVVAIAHENMAFKDSESPESKLIYIKNLQIESIGETKALHITDRNNVDYTVANLIDNNMSVSQFVSSTRDMLGIGKEHEVFMLKDYEGLYSEYRGEYIPLTSINSETISKEDAVIVASSKIDTQLYIHIIDESAQGDLSIKQIEKNSSIHLDLIREGDTNNPGVFTRDYITSIDMDKGPIPEVELSQDEIEKVKSEYEASIPVKEDDSPKTIEDLPKEAPEPLVDDELLLNTEKATYEDFGISCHSRELEDELPEDGPQDLGPASLEDFDMEPPPTDDIVYGEEM